MHEVLSMEFYGMSYQVARGMVVQKNFDLDKTNKKLAKLPFVISFHF